MSQPFGPQMALLFGLALQLTPHLPQLVVSSSFTHAPLQGLKPSSHTKPQPLALQVGWPLATAGQPLPQPRQLAGSALVSTHDPPQLLVVPGHVVRHSPPPQTWPSPHGLSQPPQWAGLTSVSTQAVPHSA